MSTLLQVQTPKIPGVSLWLWGNEVRKIFCLASFLVGFSGNRRVSQVFGLLQMVVFDDEGNMVERFAEIDTHASLEGTYRSRRVRFFS